MPIDQNEFDISLLRRDPDAFLILCQKYIHINVKYYIKRGMFDRSEYDDIVQMVNELLIRKLPSIAAHFSGEVLLRTYVGVVLQNICLQIYRQQKNTVITIPLPETLAHNSSPEHDLIIEGELKRLHTVLQMYHDDRFKILICFKLHLRIPLQRSDITKWCPAIHDDDRELLMMAFGGMFEEMSVETVFETITRMFNKYEHKKTFGDSTRRWTKAQIVKTLKLLNGNPPQRAHNEETLKILLDKYSPDASPLT